MKILLIIFSLYLPSICIANTTYVSEIDKELTIKKVLFTEANDNVNGIFSAPMSEELKNIIESDKLWDFVKYKQLPSKELSLDDYLDAPDKVSQLIKSQKADAFVKLSILKGPQGTQMRLALFTTSGIIFSLKEVYIIENQDIHTLKEELRNLYRLMVADFPFQALVLSRTANQVTISRGRNANINLDDEFSVIQIISIERHPKFNFIVNSQKEILGKIHINKVEDNLSFATLVYEKENLVLQQNMKVVLKKPIEYPHIATSKNEAVMGKLSQRGDSELVLGNSNSVNKSNEEWKPSHQPTFGKVSLSFGIGNYQANQNLTANGGVGGQSPLAMDLDLNTELWLSPTYFAQLNYDQGAATISNSYTGSSPSNLTFSMTKYDLLAGMNILLNDDYFGPKLQILLGLTNFQSSPNQSTPVAFTSMTYSGYTLGVRGFLPLREPSLWTFGGETFLSLMPTTQESPVNSGNVDNTSIISFAGFSNYKLKENLNVLGKISMDTYNTNFSGTGTRTDSATNAAHSWLRLSAGMEYLF